jgi:hypothetical protein
MAYTQDGGETWSELENLDSDVIDLVVDPSERGLSLLVATSGHSVFRGDVDLGDRSFPVWIVGLVIAVMLLAGGYLVVFRMGSDRSDSESVETVPLTHIVEVETHTESIDRDQRKVLRILYLAAITSDAPPPQVIREYRTIDDVLRKSKVGDCFVIQ